MRFEFLTLHKPVMIYVDERYHKSHREDTSNQVLGQISHHGLLEDHRRYHSDTLGATSEGSPREFDGKT